MTNEQILIALVLAVAGATAVKLVRARYRNEFIVTDGYAGLLYHEGKLLATIPAGRHVRWGRNYRLVAIDTRKALLQVAGQEVLTADNVGVKLSVVLTTQVVDAALSVQAADNQTAHLYSATQTAIRTIVAGFTMDALLSERVSIASRLQELVAAQAASVGVQVHAAEVRDVMLPGDLRKAFSGVLKAKQEGQAALERARSESASLRNLANAARLIEGQPTLATLRFLQTLEASNAGQTFVMNDLSALLPALNTRTGKAPAAQGDAT
jgi:regulator of protease activity HflC (stomatin/prohibitin superfamily)